MIINSKQEGFTIVELLIYIAGMIILLTVIFGFIVQLYRLYQEITLPPRADRVGLITVDRIIKDIRSGQNIDLAGSDMGVADGAILINSLESGVSVEKFYYLDSGRIAYQEDDGDVDYLSPSDLNVTNFRFDQLLTGVSQGIRVDLEITYTSRDGVSTKEYNGFSIMRQSYD